MISIPDFRDEKARREWIIKNADYFTIIWLGKGNKRGEVPTLEAAQQIAQRIVEAHPDARVLIYAVYGPHDTWVSNVFGAALTPNKGKKHGGSQDSSFQR